MVKIRPTRSHISCCYYDLLKTYRKSFFYLLNLHMFGQCVSKGSMYEVGTYEKDYVTSNLV